MTAPLAGAYRKICPEPDCSLGQEAHESCLALSIDGHRCVGPLSHAHVPPKPKGGKVVAILCLFGAHLPADQGLHYLSGTKRRVRHDLREYWTCEAVGATVPGNAPCENCRDQRFVYEMSDRDNGEVLLEVPL